MELDLARQRREAHLILDLLPVDKLAAVHSLLALLVEPLSESLANAPVDEEDLSLETVASIERGQRCFERGESTSHEEMLREFTV